MLFKRYSSVCFPHLSTFPFLSPAADLPWFDLRVAPTAPVVGRILQLPQTQHLQSVLGVFLGVQHYLSKTLLLVPVSFFASKGAPCPAGISVNPSAPSRLVFPYGNPIPAPPGQALKSCQNPPWSHWGWHSRCWSLSGCYSESLGDVKCCDKRKHQTFHSWGRCSCSRAGKSLSGGFSAGIKNFHLFKAGFFHTQKFFAQKQKHPDDGEGDGFMHSKPPAQSTTLCDIKE